MKAQMNDSKAIVSICGEDMIIHVFPSSGFPIGATLRIEWTKTGALVIKSRTPLQVSHAQGNVTIMGASREK